MWVTGCHWQLKGLSVIGHLMTTVAYTLYKLTKHADQKVYIVPVPRHHLQTFRSSCHADSVKFHK